MEDIGCIIVVSDAQLNKSNENWKKEDRRRQKKIEEKEEAEMTEGRL